MVTSADALEEMKNDVGFEGKTVNANRNSTK